MSRISKKVITGVTLEEAQSAANLYAKNARLIEKKTAQMNEKLTEIRTKYEPDITSLTTELEEPCEVLEAYGKEQKGAWGDKKSFELNNCIIGFRNSPHSVEKPKQFTWASIIAFMKTSKILKPFIRTKEEVNKEELLKKKDDAKFLKILEATGKVTIEQKETFYIDTKAEG